MRDNAKKAQMYKVDKRKEEQEFLRQIRDIEEINHARKTQSKQIMKESFLS